MRIFVHESNANLTTYADGAPTTISDLLVGAGVDVIDAPDRRSAFLSVDHSPRTLRRVEQSGVPVGNRLLLQSEPSVVYPYQFTENIARKYGVVRQIGKPESEELLWPQTVPLVSRHHSVPWGEREIGAFIATDRQSPVDSSMYELRRELVPHLVGAGWSVRGVGWSDSCWQRLLFRSRIAAWTAKQRRIPNLSRHFRGVCAPRYPEIHPIPRWAKVDFLAKFRVTVVVENSPEYLSEKLFDAFLAATLPIYCGPPLRSYGIPDGLAIQVPGNVDHILLAMQGVSEERFVQYQSELSRWARSEFAQGHSRNQFARKVIKTVAGLGHSV